MDTNGHERPGPLPVPDLTPPWKTAVDAGLHSCCFVFIRGSTP